MVIRESININAPMKKVWDTFINLTSWPHWNTVMKDVSSHVENLRHGDAIQCVFRPFLFPVKLNIRIEEVIPYDRVVWSAKKKGLSAYHEFFFQDQQRGVKVISQETFTGILCSASGLFLPKKKMHSLTKIFLKDLKKVSENNLSGAV